MQCCGTPFADGDTVDWTLVADVDGDWLREVAGPDTAATVTRRQEEHGGAPEHTAVTRGVVTAIHAVRCKMAPRPGDDPRARHPVPGSARITLVHSADGWDSEEDGLSFVGYVVDLAQVRASR